MRRPRRGFTLVELVVTLVVLGALSVMTTKFISDGMTFYLETTMVQKVNADIGFVTLKLKKLFSNSVPNSMSIQSGTVSWKEGGKNYSASYSQVTFVPVESAFGFFYVAKDEKEGGFDQSERVIYAVKSPFFSIDANKYVAFSSGGSEHYYKVSEVEDLASRNLYRITLANDGDFVPLSETKRLYVIDKDRRFATVCFNSSDSTLKLFYHETVGEATSCPLSGGDLTTNVTDVAFKRVEGSYNSFGELEILYSFSYPFLNVSGRLAQRIGVGNAP